MRRVICIIASVASGQGGGDCAGQAPPGPPGEPAFPCVRSSSGGTLTGDLTVAFVELGGGGSFALEEVSDGTYRVTFSDQGELGASAALFEAGGSLALGSREIGLKAELRGEALLDGTASDVRVFRSEDEALAYVRDRVQSEAIERLPPGMRQATGMARSIAKWLLGDEVPQGEEGARTAEGGLRIGGNATGTAGPLSATLEAAARGAVRVTELPDGGRTVAVLLSGEGGANAGVPVLAELGGDAAGEYLASLRVDADGNPVALRLTVEAKGTFSTPLLNADKPAEGALEELKGSFQASERERSVVDYELALDDPALRAAALDFLAQAPRPGDGGGDAAALRAVGRPLWDGFADASTLAVRRYADDEATFGLEAKLRALGVVGGGGSGSLTISSAQLVDAAYLDTSSGRFVPWTTCTG